MEVKYMPDLNDLKRNAQQSQTHRTTRSSSTQAKEPFIPTMELQPELPDDSPKMIQGPTSRRPADFSSLPKAETPGVDVKVSPQAEIFKEGGMFDKYIERKKSEYEADMASGILNNAAPKANNDDFEDVTDDADTEATEAEAEEAELANMYQMPTVKYKKQELEPATDGPVKIGLGEVLDPDMFEEYEPADTSEAEEYETEEESVDMSDDDITEDTEFTDEEYTVEDEEEFTGDDYEEDTEEETSDDSNVKEVELDEDELNKITTTKKVVVVTGEETDEEEEAEDSEVDMADDDSASRLEELKNALTHKMYNRSKRDISNFKVVKASKSDNGSVDIQRSYAKWVLPVTGICFEMSEMGGSELDYIRQNLGGDPAQARNRLRAIYNHIVSPKPQNFDVWLKSIAFADYDQFFMGVYIAAFNEANYIPYTCEQATQRSRSGATRTVGCKKMFLTDNIPVMNMVKFKSNETKNKFYKLYDSNRYNSDGLYTAESIVISDNYAIDLKIPSLYDILIESASFDAPFREKFSNVLPLIPFIDNIYRIDWDNKTKSAVEYKKYNNNPTRTSKAKVIRYSAAIDTLTTDEYAYLFALVNDIDSKVDWYDFRIPETSCPNCRRTIKEQITTAEDMVFTRHRLGILANTSIK